MKTEKQKKTADSTTYAAAQIFVQLTPEQQEAILKLLREMVKQPD